MLAAAFFAAAAGPAHALSPGDVVENFRLLDAQERPHELYASAASKAIVLMVQGNGCPIVRQTLPALAELREQYAKKGVEFLLLNPNLQDDRASVLAEAAEFGIDLPILLDDTQLIGESLGVERTAEVFVIDPRDWKLAYRGPLDDRLSYERQKPAAEHNYLRDALDAVLAGRRPSETQVDGVGCLVNLPEQDRRAQHASISYTNTIAPLVAERCASCHAASDAAGDRPTSAVALQTHADVRAQAPRIRALLRTPSVPGDTSSTHRSLFEGARALTPAQRRTLVHWIEAGALPTPRADTTPAPRPSPRE